MEKVAKEFTELYMAAHYISQGGIEYAQEVLENALGTEKLSGLLIVFLLIYK